MSEIPFPVLLIAKSMLVLLAGASIAFLLRAASASVRYVVWALTITMLVALPLGMIAAPVWRVPVKSIPDIESAQSVVAPVSERQLPIVAFPAATGVTTEKSAAAPAASINTPSFEMPEFNPAIVWLLGVLLVTGRMIIGRASLAVLKRKSRELVNPEWRAMVDRESMRLGIERKVTLFESSRVSTPLAAGFGAPFIIVPSGSNEWDTEHREIVLRHELAHIARGDAVVCLLSGIACAIYWFNPFVWMAARRLRSEQERACDDRVITLGTPGPEYAAHLLEVARSAREIGMHSFVSVAMARPSQLEGRLLAVITDRRRNAVGGISGAFATVVAFSTLVIISAIIPVKAESAVVVASLTDYPGVFVNAPLPEKKPEVKTEPAADSSFSGDLAAESGGTLTLDLRTGAAIRITGTDERRVTIEGHLSGRDWLATDYNMLTDDKNTSLKMRYVPERGNHSSSHRLVITVPRRYNVRINSAGGDIVIRGVEGTFDGSTGGGKIDINNARGRADLSTGGGEILVQNSSLSGNVSTGGGGVLIQNVTGGLRGSSGSGGVFYGGSSSRGGDQTVTTTRGRGITINTSGVTFSETSKDGMRRASDGRLYVSKAGGDVSIANASDGAWVSTGGGSVTIGRSDGDVSISTGGGDVTVGPTRGSIEAGTGAGDVRLTVTGRGKPIDVSSGAGTVTIILPEGMDADLDLETAFTNNHRGQTQIRSDWPVSTTVTPNWDSSEGTPRRYVRTRTQIGSGGPRIRVRTVNGDIVIRRK